MSDFKSFKVQPSSCRVKEEMHSVFAGSRGTPGRV